MRINHTGFAGANLALHPKLLPDGVGAGSLNQKPGRGDLRPWRVPLAAATVPSGRATIYRMGRDAPSSSSYWLTWTTEVHACRGFDSEDGTERTYFTGSGTPKWTNNSIGLASSPYPTATRELAVPRPASAPTLTKTVDSGTGTDEDRWYCYTYVNDLGWESAPSPVSHIVVAPTDTVRANGFASVPAGNYGVTRIRLYRTITGASGATDFLLHSEILIAVTYVDDSGQALGESLATTGWVTPPADGHHLTKMWGGMMALLSGKSIRICEPHAHYAWPIAYEIVASDTPVAQAVYRQNMVVLTTGRPILISGTDPESLNDEPVAMNQACVASQSVVSFLSGVAYSSPDGLCWVGDGGSRILTAGLMLRDDWQALNPSSVVGGQYMGLYIGSYDNGGGRKGFVIDPSNPTGVYFLDTGFTACHYDDVQNALFILNGTAITKWDAGASAMTCSHLSKVFRTDAPVNFGYAEVEGDDLATTPATVKVWADGALKLNRTVTSRSAFTLPSGFLATLWQIEVATQGNVQGISLAESPMELAKR